MHVLYHRITIALKQEASKIAKKIEF